MDFSWIEMIRDAGGIAVAIYALRVVRDFSGAIRDLKESLQDRTICPYEQESRPPLKMKRP